MITDFWIKRPRFDKIIRTVCKHYINQRGRNISNPCGTVNETGKIKAFFQINE